MISKKFNTETIVTVRDGLGSGLLVFGSGVGTVESVRNLSRDMFAAIQGELSESTYHW